MHFKKNWILGEFLKFICIWFNIFGANCFARLNIDQGVARGTLSVEILKVPTVGVEEKFAILDSLDIWQYLRR